MVNCTFNCCSWQHKTQSRGVMCQDSLDFNILWTMLTQGHPRRIKGLNLSFINKCMSKLFSYPQTSNTNWWRVGLFSNAFVKKYIQTCTYTDYGHNSIITHPVTWLDTYCSAHSHKVWTLSVHGTQTHHTPWDMTGHTLLSTRSQSLNYQTWHSKYAGFYTTLGLGHMFVSAQHTVAISTRNVISSPSQRSTHTQKQSVGFL